MKHAPIIFLDFDGVVIPRGALHKPFSSAFHTDAIACLNTLCADTGAQVVLITTRRHFDSPEKLTKALTDAGFTGPFHADPCIESQGRPLTRGKSIDDWCSTHGVTPQDYIIIDDHTRGLSRTQQTRLVMPVGAQLCPAAMEAAKQKLAETSAGIHTGQIIPRSTSAPSL